MSGTKSSYSMTPTEERDMLQLMRGFAILLVVLQHSVVLFLNSNASMIFISICVFIDVHIFMFVSGYLFQKKSDAYYQMGIRRFTLKKFKSLGVPYLFWESVLFFGAFILYRLPFSGGASLMEAIDFQKLSLPQIFIGLLTFRYSYVQLYWFLFALFWVFLINYSCRKFSCRIEFILLFFVLFSVLAVIFKSDDYILTKTGRSFLTFGLGRLFQKYRLERHLFKNWLIIPASIVTFYIVFKVRVHEENEYLYKILFSFRLTLMGMIGIIFFFVVSSFLIVCPSKLTGLILLLGNYSLPIYLLHNPWIVHVSSIAFKKLSMPSPVGSALSFALGLTLPILLYKYVMKKTPALSRIMLGI